MNAGVSRGLNQRVLRVFGPLLILTGISGFVIPPEIGLMSGAEPYNIFHCVFGVLGVYLAFRGDRPSLALVACGAGALHRRFD